MIDTLARSMAGGSENDSEDMGNLVRAADRLREEFGATVLFIHHSGKDATRGARGHSSLRAAVDTEIEVAGLEGTRTARVTKQRDFGTGEAFSFDLEAVTL
ncbi:AAA family ATPase, partial [Arthrospira platensis SPKY2]